VDAVAGAGLGSGDLEFFTRAPKAINTAIHSSLSSIEDAYRIIKIRIQNEGHGCTFHEYVFGSSCLLACRENFFDFTWLNRVQSPNITCINANKIDDSGQSYGEIERKRDIGYTYKSSRGMGYGRVIFQFVFYLFFPPAKSSRAFSHMPTGLPNS